MNGSIRPTKKQREILTFIENFIAEHGYSPSYREIMAGLNYTSVATVALHVNSLIKRGHIRKRDRSARSLEVVRQPASAGLKAAEITPGQEKWLVDLVEQRFTEMEQHKEPDPKKIDELYVLVGALKILGLEGAAVSFIPRLTAMRSAPAAQ